ncbi:hypothetical protein LIN78_12145 [Leeia sp. TBRC 13508]|uniref:Uncharacterized protein n=1 Tax=Leeia speluncae TaxID=2884804 RepID=A0ABS8D7Z9_9NEIS|nr:hypothetical protein [Leeia speluncae]MCB6184296.1 hypothetical protein [Leeia speluncae]
MRKVESLNTNAGELLLKEMTVQEIQAMIKNADSHEGEFDLVGSLISDKFTLSELAYMVEGSPDFGALTQTDLDALEEQLTKLNPRFFALKDRVRNMVAVDRETSLGGN